MTITKYNASGNTFVIFHTNKRENYSDLAIKLCQEENADGLIVVVPHSIYDFEWLFYNNDGSAASMCGNGTRAVAHYAYENKISSNFVKFLTGAGEINCNVTNDVVETTMPKPKSLKEVFEEVGFTWWMVDTGVHHLVAIVEDLDTFNVELCSSMRHKYNANVNFANIKDGIFKVRTYEKGVEAETLACGTGVTACFLRALSLNLINNPVDIYPKSGEKLTLKKDEFGLYFKGQVFKEYTKDIE